MTKETAIISFNNKKIRTFLDEMLEKWYFSIVNVVGILSDSKNPQIYWRVLKKRLLDEGNETVTNCNALDFKRNDHFNENLKLITKTISDFKLYQVQAL